MFFPLRRLLPALALLALVVPSIATAQPAEGRRRDSARPAEAGFGPWLDPSHEAPAGMQYRTFPSRLAGTDVSYVIYLPPGYETATDRRYPVVYWLHGRGGSQTGAGGFAGRLDAAIRAGKAPAAIVVGVNGRRTSSWVDSFDGKSPVQSVIIEELIPHIDATYRTLARREGRAVEGFSMGGAGAPKLGFKHTEVFGAVGILGGALHDLESYRSRGTAFQDIYGGDEAYYLANDAWSLLERNAGALRGRTFVRVAVGAKDRLVDVNTAYHEKLAQLGIEHAFDVIPDAEHNPGQVYDGLGDKTWEFYTRAFAAATGSATAPAATTAAAAAPAPAARARPDAGARPGAGNEAPNAWSGVGTVTGWQVLTARAEDGRETPALWVAPPGPGPFPAIVWFHGAPANQGERGERSEADRGRFDLFLQAGFVVCLGDYRSEPAPTPEVSGVDDAVAILRHVKSLPMVDPQRVAVMGHSLGGATTLLAAMREPVACVVDSAAAAYAVLGMPMGSLRGKPAGGELPETDYDQTRAVSLLEKISAPTLILYGQDDPLSRINKTIHDLMKGLDKDVRLEVFPDEHHGMLFRPRDRERGLRAWTTMVDFVSGVLKPAAATAPRAAAPRANPPAVAAPAVPEGTKALRDLAYIANGHERQKLDLYLPTDATRPTPVIVWIHGGGWAGGDKAGCPPLTSGYTRRGYAAASLNYRLSGDALFPAQIEDCKAALRWLRAHTKEYNLDPDRIAVWGGSAGGHLVALLAATGTTREFDVGDHLDQSSAVQAAVDFFGPTDLLQMDAHALPGARLVHDSAGSPESRLVGGPIQEPKFRPLAQRVNPIPYLTRSAPPHLIVHGDQDPLVPHHQSELLFAALKQLGVPVRFHTIVGAGHGTGFGGREIAAMVAAFLDHHLLGHDTEAARWPAAMTSDSPASAAPAASRSDAPRTASPDQPAPPRPAQSGRQRPTWTQFTERYDADRDGRVLQAEFKGPPGIFQRLDRNGDGVVTLEEFEQGGPPR